MIDIKQKANYYGPFTAARNCSLTSPPPETLLFADLSDELGFFVETNQGPHESLDPFSTKVHRTFTTLRWRLANPLPKAQLAADGSSPQWDRGAAACNDCAPPSR